MAAPEGKGRKTIRLRYRAHTFHPRNEEGHCLWCGRRLPTPVSRPAVVPEDCMGGYWDNAFCGLRCGYCFGVKMAEFGERLTTKETADA